MRRTPVILLIAGIALAGLAAYAFLRKAGQATAPSPTASPGIGTAEPAASPSPAVRVSAPSSDATIESPLTVRGTAPGSWFFEGQFPVSLLDGSGVEIARGIVAAQGEWMTTEDVPFEGTLTFAAPASAVGVLVLERDNPSGLPENAQSTAVPVRFR